MYIVVERWAPNCEFCYCLVSTASCDIGHLRCDLLYIVILICMWWYKVLGLKRMW